MCTTRKTYVSRMYKQTHMTCKGIYSDSYWKGVHDAAAACKTAIADVPGASVTYWVEDGGYRKDEYGRDMRKEYELQVTIPDLKNSIRGRIIASAAGSVEYPLDRYDITVIFF